MSEGGEKSWERIGASRAQMDTAWRGTGGWPNPEPGNPAWVGITRLRDIERQTEGDPQYQAMLKALRGKLDAGKLDRAVEGPVTLTVGRDWPLYASEMAALAASLGVQVSAKKIERMAKEGLLSPPVLLGDGEWPVYGKRQLVELLYSEAVLGGLKPERAKAWREVLSGQIDDATWLYLKGLPQVPGPMAVALERVKHHWVSEGPARDNQEEIWRRLQDEFAALATSGMTLRHGDGEVGPFRVPGSLRQMEWELLEADGETRLRLAIRPDTTYNGKIWSLHCESQEVGVGYKPLMGLVADVDRAMEWLGDELGKALVEAPEQEGPGL